MKRRTCSVLGCDRFHEARGWCKPHYDRFLRHGDPLAGGKPRLKGETVSPLWKTRTQDAAELGMSRRSLQYRLQIVRSIPDDIHDSIRELPIADSTTELLALARMPEQLQRDVVVLLRYQHDLNHSA